MIFILHSDITLTRSLAHPLLQSRRIYYRKKGAERVGDFFFIIRGLPIFFFHSIIIHIKKDEMKYFMLYTIITEI